MRILPAHTDPLLYQPEIETLPVAGLRRLQSERLRGQINYLYQRVPWYRQQLDAAGIRPDSIRDIRDIHRLPFTYKSALRDNYPFGLFAVPKAEIARIHCSSGTTGKPTVVGYTKGDLQIFAEVIARSLMAAGCRPGMILQNAYGYGLFTGGLGLHYGAELLGMTVVPVSGGMTDRQFTLLQDFGSDAICCTPSYALTLAEEMRKRGIDRSQLRLRLAILGAEPWTESIRAGVESGLGVTATNIYGLSEIIGPGVSQEDADEKGTGSYIWEDHFFPEIVDRESGQPLKEGEAGVLVLTTLTKKAMPVLRYWTGDITSLHYDRAGRRTHIKMMPIIGRADDMLIIRGVNLFHTQVECLLEGYRELSPNYRIIVRQTGSLDEVDVEVELDGMYYRELAATTSQVPDPLLTEQVSVLRDRLGRKIKDNIGLNMQVLLTLPGSIPRSEGGKLGRIVDLRKRT